VRLDTCTGFSFPREWGAKDWSVFFCDGLSDLVSGVSCELIIAKEYECSEA
jgi:hypothetical protein